VEVGRAEQLSLGVEHFDDEILSINGRAHKSPEIYRAYQWAREVGFDQINIDLIAGMLGETEDKWKYAVQKGIELDPDSVTIYQMEVPFNSKIAKDALAHGGESDIASWETKRRWVDYAFGQFEAADLPAERWVVEMGRLSPSECLVAEGSSTKQGFGVQAFAPSR